MVLIIIMFIILIFCLNIILSDGIGSDAARVVVGKHHDEAGPGEQEVYLERFNKPAIFIKKC
jgi:hypothetical protein